jgi:hypothetical protein
MSKDTLFEITEEPNGLWKSRSVKKWKLALLTDCFTREFPSLNLQAGGEQGEEMADDGDLGFTFQNSGSGEGLSEEEVDWNQGCSTEDWSASSKLLHIYRHSKKSFQILRNRVQKPKRLAIKQSVDQHPLQGFKMMNICPDEASTVPGPNAELMKYPARLTYADAINSNSSNFMSLQELEEHIFAKRQVTHGERNSSHLSLGYLMILRARVSGEWWIYIQIYQLSRVRRWKSL